MPIASTTPVARARFRENLTLRRSRRVITATRAMSTSPKSPPAVVSTTTFAVANERDLLAACETFLPNGPFALSPTSGGVNNHVRYVDDAGGARRVVRLYNNGQETARVAFEHAALEATARVAKARNSGFRVPEALKSLKDGASTYVILPSGDAASVFELIPGALPKTRFAAQVGEATAELSACMVAAESEVRKKYPTSPTSVYRNIFGAFEKKGGSRAGFYEEANSNAGLDGVRPAVNRLLDYIRALETRLKEIELAGGLPTSLIHGDVHYDNALVDFETGKVTGIIDFEFASYDWVLMNCASGLSKYVGEKNPGPYVEDYIRGYARKANLTEAEIEALPDLVKLRVLETVVYFVARSAAKEDDISQLALRAENYAARVDWISANADFIRTTMRDALAANANA